MWLDYIGLRQIKHLDSLLWSLPTVSPQHSSLVIRLCVQTKKLDEEKPRCWRKKQKLIKCHGCGCSSRLDIDQAFCVKTFKVSTILTSVNAHSSSVLLPFFPRLTASSSHKELSNKELPPGARPQGGAPKRSSATRSSHKGHGHKEEPPLLTPTSSHKEELPRTGRRRRHTSAGQDSSPGQSPTNWCQPNPPGWSSPHCHPEYSGGMMDICLTCRMHSSHCMSPVVGLLSTCLANGQCPSMSSFLSNNQGEESKLSCQLQPKNTVCCEPTCLLHICSTGVLASFECRWRP